jgi:hypothetical protein
MVKAAHDELPFELLTQHVSDDYVMIRRFLDVTERKFPYYVSNFLNPVRVGRRQAILW